MDLWSSLLLALVVYLAGVWLIRLSIAHRNELLVQLRGELLAEQKRRKALARSQGESKKAA
jgi:hypothetical protein